ncbi:hypothetical protein [Mucilaginibacter defluvii]|uniref:Uncharacterized protein n=1 Tax=Mucilaginibacter defluvii TaxID=1196019 RepID=A0ABP9G6H3_9SPHI
MQPDEHFDGFPFKAEEVKRYIAVKGLVSMLLTNGSFFHYEPADETAFLNWLKYHRVEDLRKNYPDEK